MKKIFLIFILLSIFCIETFATAEADRWAYVLWAKREIPGSLINFNNMASYSDFLTTSEAQALSKMVKYITDRATKIENSYEIYDFSTQLILSNDQSLFKLSPQEPIRTAVTTSEPESPIYFNAQIINDSLSTFGPLDAVQLLIHELGRKIVPENQIVNVDSMAAKLRKEFEKKIFVKKVDANLTITVPVLWHTMMSNSLSAIDHPLSFLIERNGNVRYYLRKFNFQAFQIGTGLNTYLTDRLVEVGPVAPTAGAPYFEPIKNATVNPTIVANRQIQQITDLNYNIEKRQIQFRIEHQNSLMIGLVPQGVYHAFNDQFLYYHLTVSIDDLNQDEPVSEFSYQLRLNDETPISRLPHNLTPTRMTEGGLDKIKIDASSLLYKNSLHLQVQISTPIEELQIMIQQTKDSIGKAIAEFSIDWSRFTNQNVKVTGLVVDKLETYVFKNQLNLKSPLTMTTTKGSHAQINSFQIESLSGWRNWGFEPFDLFDIFIPKISASVAPNKSFRMVLSTTEKINTLYLNWHELVYIEHNDFLLGVNKAPRKRFLTPDEFEQTIDLKSGTSTVTLKLPEPMQKLTPELKSLQDTYDLLKITANFDGISAITQIEIVTAMQKISWNEFSNPNVRLYLTYLYDRNQK